MQSTETPQNALTLLDQAVLAIDECTAQDDLAAIVNRVEFMKSAIREIDQQLKAALLEWLNAEPGRSLEIGPVRYYVGTKKKTVAGDAEKLLDALFTATGGDFQKVADCLGANAFKPGACRNPLGDDWAAHFTEIVEDDVKTGKPRKEVKSIDTRFIR